MLTRADAIGALDGEPFDVLVIGGGITGAGVALDAATRGYSVALVERGDFAIGTSSRSSKLVHGGLRYLQNFDLGLVREALLERQINVALAPHLVKPLPLIVPAFDGARPDRLVGLGLNMYDVMAVDRISPLGRRRDRNRDGAEDWSPARHRVISGEEVAELLPALAGRSPSGGYLFYDCQTDDVRLVLTVLAEAERFGAVAVNGVEALSLLEEGGRAVGARVRDAESGAELEVRAANVVNATGVWADRLRPEELHDEAEVPVIRPSRGTHIILEGSTLPVVAGAIAPAGGGRTIFVLPWLGQTLIGTTDNDYEGDLQHVQPSLDDVGYLLAATNAFFVDRAGPRGRRGRLRGRAAADLHRRPQEVRRHLAQGRALRDLQRDGHDHRRQADDLAADGEDDRRPDRRARGPRRPVPHRQGPARDGRRGRRPAARARRGARGLRAARRAATATRRTRCCGSPASGPSWPSRWCRAASTCSRRPPTRRGASRRAPSPTC